MLLTQPFNMDFLEGFEKVQVNLINRLKLIVSELFEFQIKQFETNLVPGVFNKCYNLVYTIYDIEIVFCHKRIGFISNLKLLLDPNTANWSKAASSYFQKP